MNAEQQKTESWFASRRGKVTGSVVGAILGVDPIRSRDAVMKSMVRNWILRDEMTAPSNPAIYWGLTNESNALMMLSLELGVAIAECDSLPHPEVDWFSSTPDGLFVENEMDVQAKPVEVKCPYSRKLKPLAEQPHYAHQVQAHLEVTQADYGYFMVWTPEEHLIERVERNETWWAEVAPALREFYDQFLKIVANQDAALSYLQENIVKRTDSQWLTLVQEYRLAKLAVEKAEANRDKIKNRMIEEAGRVSSSGGGVLLKKTRSVSVTDYRKACVEHGIDLSKYTKKSGERWMVMEV